MEGTNFFVVLSIIFFWFLASLNASSILHLGTGHAHGYGSCLLDDGDGGRKYGGTCTLLKNCNASLSDLRAGIKPQLCEDVPKGRGELIVCCRAQKRQSELRCQEYSRIRSLFRKATEVVEQSEVSDRIVGGIDVKEDEFPFVVALGYSSESSGMIWGCGGTLISEDFVLTAAHCVQTAYGNPKRVLAGDIRLKKNHTAPAKSRTIAAVTQIYTHPEYKKLSKYHDIALLKLGKKMFLSESISPACLPSPKERLERDIFVKVMGWGRLENGGSQANILQVAKLRRASQESCEKFCDRLRRKNVVCPQGILRSQFCAGDKERDTCDGDSGGPLVVRRTERSAVTDYVVGLTSFGSQLCGVGMPGVYTNIQSYLTWIENIVWPNS